MARWRPRFSALAFGWAAAPATAEEILFGLIDTQFERDLFGADSEVLLAAGIDDFPEGATRTQAAAFAAEYRTAPFAVTALGSELRLGFAAEVDTGGDLWGGLGFAHTIPIYEGLRIETSLMMGFYLENDTPLNYPLEFRSQGGISYEVVDRVRLGVHYEHKSNAGLGGANPGVETLLFSVGYRY